MATELMSLVPRVTSKDALVAPEISAPFLRQRYCIGGAPVFKLAVRRTVWPRSAYPVARLNALPAMVADNAAMEGASRETNAMLWFPPAAMSITLAKPVGSVV